MNDLRNKPKQAKEGTEILFGPVLSSHLKKPQNKYMAQQG
jgi:hypothetical protein